MRIPSYLIRSRHHTFYFRWPLPEHLRAEGKTPYLKLSLGTCDPKQAMPLAKLLEYYASQAVNHPGISALPYGETFPLLKSYLSAVIAQAKTGQFSLPETGLKSLPQISEITPVTEPNIASGWGTSRIAQIPLKQAEIPLKTVMESYVSERHQSGVWGVRGKAQIEDCLSTLLEILGEGISVTEMDYAKARKVKQTLARIPLNRNKVAQTRDLPLMQQIEVEGLPRLSIASLNKYLTCYSGLFKWARKHGYTKENPFAEMQFKEVKGKKRDAFQPEQIALMLAELDKREDGLADKDYKYWGAMIALFTGARLNEISSLTVQDVKQEGEIWYFDINDVGDGKRLKTAAAIRKVPIHSELIARGFLEHVERIRAKGSNTRLLPELTYFKKEGWGRKLGRWFNDVFLVALELKTSRTTFHSLRHTVITHLRSAEVDNGTVRVLVGHEPDGVTETTYNHVGLATLKKAMERLSYSLPVA